MKIRNNERWTNMKFQTDGIFRSVFAMESSKLPLNMDRYTQAILEFSEEELNPANYDNAKKKFIDLIEEPRLSVQRDYPSSDVPAISIIRQNATNAEKNPFEYNEVICNFWDKVIPKDNPQFSTMYPKKCEDFASKLASDPEVACNSIESRNLGILKNTVHRGRNLAESFDQRDFYPVTADQKPDVDATIENGNQETYSEICEHLKKYVRESTMDAFNKAILYTPYIDNFFEKVKQVSESSMCTFKDDVTPKLAVAVYEAMNDGLIQPYDATLILECINDYSMNEFSVGAMLPMMGSTEGFGTVLAKTPIEKVIQSTNSEIDNCVDPEFREKEIKDAYTESVFEFLEFVSDLYIEGLLEDDICPALQELFVEGFFDTAPDYSKYDEGKLRSLLKEYDTKLDGWYAFMDEARALYKKMQSEAYKDFDEWKGMKAKDKIKEKVSNAKNTLSGNKDQVRKRNMDEHGIAKEFTAKYNAAVAEIRKKYEQKYHADYDWGMSRHEQPFRDVEGTERGSKNAAMMEREIPRIKKELQNRENARPVTPKEKEKEVETSTSVTSQNGKIIDISAYKRKQETGKKPEIKKVHYTSKGNNAFKESVDLMGMMLLESGVEEDSIICDIFESFFDCSYKDITTMYIEATTQKDDSNIIFETECKKIFDQIYKFMEVKSNDRKKEFTAHMSADKNKNLFYIKEDDAMEKAIPNILSGLGYKREKDIKKHHIFKKEVKNVIITVDAAPSENRILVKYDTISEVTEFVSFEAANIDDDIKPILNILNRKGYITKYSCSGHENTRIIHDRDRNGVYNGKLYTTARITFDKIYDFPSIPDRWRVSNKDGKTSIYSNPYSYGEHQGTPNQAFPKWKEMYMATLKSWAEALPKVGEKKPEVIKESVTFDEIFYDTMQRFM